MSRYFEPVDYASLQVMIAEGEIALEQAQAVTRSVVAENSGLLLAVSDAIGLLLKLASGFGMNPDEAEALPAVKLLRAALDIPATEDVLQTLVGQRLLSNQNALKEIAA